MPKSSSTSKSSPAINKKKTAAKPAPQPERTRFSTPSPAGHGQVSARGGEVIEPKKPGTSVALPSELDEFEHAETGLENVTAKDLLIPRLTIIQKLSPQLIRSKPEFNPDAQEGDFCDTGTGDLWREGITILPCFFARVFLEWAPRSTGKGLIHNHGTDASILEKCKIDEKRRAVLPSGNYIAETATWFVLNLSANKRRSFIPLASTQLKSSRRWMTLLTSERLTNSAGVEFPPPIYWRSWDATGIEQSNNDGSWVGWKLDPARNILELDPTKSLLREAKEFYAQSRDGLVMGDLNMAAEEAVVQDDAGGHSERM
jgi:hypothetical protein